MPQKKDYKHINDVQRKIVNKINRYMYNKEYASQNSQY